jgi:hypothetical protein
LQELKERRLFQAIFFSAFGVIFEIVIFLGGLYVLQLIPGNEVAAFRMILLICFQIGLVILIFIDVKRAWTGYWTKIPADK